MEAITEVYEPQWSGSEALYAQASSIEVLWQDFSHKLGDQVLIPLNTYTAQFPEMRVSRRSIELRRDSQTTFLCRKKSISADANWLTTTASVILSKIFKQTLRSARMTLNWQRDVKILRKPNALMNFSTRNCTMNFQPFTTRGYSSLSRTCKHSSLRSKCSTTRRRRFTTNLKRSLTNWPPSHSEVHTHWRNLTVSRGLRTLWSFIKA